jgi:hypothetical protein
LLEDSVRARQPAPAWDGYIPFPLLPAPTLMDRDPLLQARRMVPTARP